MHSYDQDFNRGYSSSSNLVVIGLIITTVLTVGMVVYAIFLFIDITRITDAANFKVNENLKMVAKNAEKKLYSDKERGIINWYVYRKGNFEIKYPNDWKKIKDTEVLLNLRKFNQVEEVSLGFDLRVMEVKNQKFEDFVKEKLGIWKNEWQKNNGHLVALTEKTKQKDGTLHQVVIFQKNEKIIALEGTYYNLNTEPVEKTFNLIIDEFNLL